MPRTRTFVAPAVAVLATAALAAPAGAATFTVNSFTDAADASPGNGVCASGGNACTLRAAIQEAGGLAGADTITLPSGNYQLIAGLGQLAVGTSVTINGAGARTTTIRAASGSRVFSISATSTLRDLTVTGGNLTGTSTLVGGGIRVAAGDVTLERVTVRDNAVASSQAASGGGVGADTDTGSLTLIDSTISGNSTLGAYNGSSQGAAGGGGVYTLGPAIIKRSTIAGNTATGGVTNYATGGGASIAGLATIEQSTFAGNGVATVADSSGFRQGGNLYLSENATISGSILAAGTGTNGPDCYRDSGVVVTEPAKNLASTVTDCLGASSLRGVDPKLGSLADNGGPTDTMRPAAGSPVIDGAANCGSRTTDQRGNALFGGTGCDLGAVETAASRAVQLQASKTTAAAGDDVTFVAKIDNAGVDDATGESLTLELPAGVTATTATTSAGTCATAGNVVCALGTLGRSASATVIVTVRAPGSAFSVTARRSGPVPDQSAADDAATVQIAGAGTPGPSGGSPGTGTGTGTPQSDTIAPSVTGLALVKKPRPRVKKGATLRFTLSEAASVQVKVERLLPGRTSAGACKAKGTGKRCTRAVLAATVTRQLAAGAQTMTLTKSQLRTGTLRFTILATDAAGNRSVAGAVQGKVSR